MVRSTSSYGHRLGGFPECIDTRRRRYSTIGGHHGIRNARQVSSRPPAPGSAHPSKSGQSGDTRPDSVVLTRPLAMSRHPVTDLQEKSHEIEDKDDDAAVEGILMRKSFVLVVLVAALAACATPGKGTAIGAGGGAAVRAGVGARAGGWEGAAVGRVGGGLAGGATRNYLAKTPKEPQDAGTR